MSHSLTLPQNLDARKLYQDKRLAIIADGKKAETFGTAAKCDVCLDKHYLPVHSEWLIMLEMPADFDAQELLFNRCDNVVWIPCDCHGGTVLDGYDDKKEEKFRAVKRFSDVFGGWATDSAYGKRIKQFYLDRAEQRWQDEQNRLYAPQVEIGEIVADIVKNSGLWAV
jgi:hypothetical protein